MYFSVSLAVKGWRKKSAETRCANGNHYAVAFPLAGSDIVMHTVGKLEQRFRDVLHAANLAFEMADAGVQLSGTHVVMQCLI